MATTRTLAVYAKVVAVAIVLSAMLYTLSFVLDVPYIVLAEAAAAGWVANVIFRAWSGE